MANKETLHFTYESPENLVRLLVGINYEKTHSMREISIYRERLDKEEDSFFYKIMCELYPDGCTIDVKQIQEITDRIHSFLETDEEAKDIRLRYEMHDCKSYVYYKLDKHLYPCKVGEHAMIIRECCVDYFKDVEIEQTTPEKVRQFILDNFIIKSEFSTLKGIANDSYIHRCCVLDRPYSEDE